MHTVVQKPVVPSAPDECIDQTVFEQILELDDDDDKSFSKGMVDAYFEQAEKTFTEMDDALCALASFPSIPVTLTRRFRVEKNLAALSDLGHFLKGSSAALGVSKVQSACEDIQHYGKLREGSTIITEAEAIVKITKALVRAREDYEKANKWLDNFYASYDVEDD